MGGVAELHGQTFVPEMKHRTYDWYLKLLPKMGKAFPGAKTLWSTCIDWAFPSPSPPAPIGSKSRPI